MEHDPRYPYTHAADLLRVRPEISRSDASQIRRLVAEALGMDDAELARKLADSFLSKEDKLAAARLADFLRGK